MEREGPMWRRDWPEGEDARRAVRFEERVLDSVRRADSLEFKMAVDSVDRQALGPRIVIGIVVIFGVVFAVEIIIAALM